uniref:DDT domain-containing protein n=1 Tax=Brassica oleracea TaxID=3712 RepID=A0A3P6H6F9_BRAOL|nr:unnamed protein product [Brassica oleracea]
MDDEIMNNISETRIEDQTQIRESSYCHQEIGCCRKLRDKEAKHDMYGEVQRDPRACCIERRPALLQMQGNFAIVVNACNEGYNEENPAAGKRTKPILKKKEKSQLEDVKLPQGSESITVFGIDLPSENAGRVLQFLEFCSKFGKALGLRGGEPQLVVSEIVSGRNTRSQEHSVNSESYILERRSITAMTSTPTPFCDWKTCK